MIDDPDGGNAAPSDADSTASTDGGEGYEEARALVEDALDAYARGEDEAGDRLIDEAKKLNLAAVEDVYEELEEDASSEHDPEKIGGEEDSGADEEADEESEHSREDDGS